MTHTPILIAVIVLIVGSIAYFELKKPERAPVSQNAVIPLSLPADEPTFKSPENKISSDTAESDPSKNSGNNSFANKNISVLLEQKAKTYSRAKEIVSPSGFLNSNPFTIANLIGEKIILVDFWTYSCINCQRTLPYLNAWYQKYKDKGLEIVGIHTPEFEFEKKQANVQAAITKYGIEYPVVQDNDYATWSAYGNRYWPRKYIIDIDGFIVFDHIGEGAYEETEITIQKLLEERATRLGISETVTKDVVKPMDSEMASAGGSPEVYFGALRNTYLGNGNAGKIGLQTLSEPSEVKTNVLYLVGMWNFQKEYAENTSPEAKIIFRYKGKSVYMVSSAEKSVSMTILRDGKPLQLEKGEDIFVESGQSSLAVQEDRLYKLIRDPEEANEHVLEIIIHSSGLRVFTFTFG